MFKGGSERITDMPFELILALICYVIVSLAIIYFGLRNDKREKENRELRRKVHRYEYREKSRKQEKWERDFKASLKDL